MKEYQEIVAAFQVGARRVIPPPTTAIPDIPNVGPEKKLLLQAGIGALMIDAGAKPIANVRPIPESPNEDRKVADRAAEPLAEAFDLGHKSIVKEWAREAARRGQVAPYRILPSLIEFAKEEPESIFPVLGSRGRWLIETLGVELRQKEASQFDQANPDEVREWLGSNLDDSGFDDRLDAILALKPSVSAGDEPLLERALQDKRKEIRTVAAEMLATLPNSRVSEELIQLADCALGHEKSILKEKLTVELPELEQLPKWVPKPSATGTAGPKAEALRQILSLIPPSHWQARFRTPPQKFLTLAAKTDFKQVVTSGIAQAAILFQDQIWIDECFEFLFDQWTQLDPEYGEITHLASETAFDDLIVRLLPENKSRNHSITYALAHRGRQFSPRLTKAIVKNFDPAFYGGSLSDLLYALDPHSAADLYFEYVEGRGISAAQINKLAKIIPLRIRLLSSLNPL